MPLPKYENSANLASVSAEIPGKHIEILRWNNIIRRPNAECTRVQCTQVFASWNAPADDHSVTNMLSQVLAVIVTYISVWGMVECGSASKLFFIPVIVPHLHNMSMSSAFLEMCLRTGVYVRLCPGWQHIRTHDSLSLFRSSLSLLIWWFVKSEEFGESVSPLLEISMQWHGPKYFSHVESRGEPW